MFDSPRDPIIFDTGHQAYVHKMLTGRSADSTGCAARAGFRVTRRAPSEHDWVESSHASAALSYADGLAKAFELQGQRNRHVVAVVGDGALTGGMCWEALNNIAAAKRPLVIVVNDNGRSYAPTIGGSPNISPACACSRPTSGCWSAAAARCGPSRSSVRLCFQAMHSVKAGIRTRCPRRRCSPTSV